ncbi:MAG: tetratricopeptide repeat protein [Pirellulales bacterium]
MGLFKLDGAGCGTRSAELRERRRALVRLTWALLAAWVLPGLGSPTAWSGENKTLPVQTGKAIVSPDESPPDTEKLRREILFRAARNAVALGDLPEALSRFEALLDAFPEDTTARREYAGILAQARRDTDAILQYETLLKKTPDDVVVRRAYAGLLARVDRIQEAITQYGTLLKAAPGDTVSRKAQAGLLAQVGRDNDAILEYETLLRKTPEDTTSRRAYAGLLAKAGRVREAIAQYETLLKAVPEDMTSRKAQAGLLAQAGRDREAILQYETLLGKTPDDLASRKVYAGLLAKAGRVPEAIAQYDALLKAVPKDAVSRKTRAGLLAQAGRDKDAILEYEKLLAASPADAVLRKQYAGLLARAGRIPDAIAQYETLLKAAPKDAALRKTRAGLLAQTGRDKDAILEYENLLAASPADATLRGEYAGLLARSGRIADATAQYERLLASRPKDTDFRRTLVDLLIAMNARDKAADELRLILKNSPGDIAAATKLARLHAWQRNRTEALAVYRTYLEKLDRSKPKVQELLAPLLLDMDRPAEALPLLAAMQARRPEDFDTAADFARCHAMLGDEPGAAAAIEKLAAAMPGNAEGRLKLARFLFDQGYPRPASTVYVQILAAHPQNVPARLGVARCQLFEYELGRARDTLRAIPLDKQDGAMVVLVAEYHRLTGEYADAEALLRDRLDLAPRDLEARLALGELYLASQEYERAEAEYSKVLCLSPRDRCATVQLARALAFMRRFDESNAVCRELLARDPNDAETRILQIQNLAKVNRLAEAESLCRKQLLEGENGRQGTLDLRATLAWLLVQRREPSEAVGLYQELLERSDGDRPDVRYGLYRAWEEMGRCDEARQALVPTEASGSPIGYRIRVADLAIGDCHYALATGLLCEGLERKPESIPARFRLGEALFYQMADDQVCLAVRHFDQVLACSPKNIRARLGLTRALVRLREFRGAYAEYEALLDVKPDYPLALREKARFVQDWKGFETASGVYDEAVHEVVGEDEMEIARFAPDDEPVGDGGQAARDEDLALDLQALDDEAALVQQSNIAAEKRAKCLKDWRPQAAIEAYASLIAQEPRNQHVMFDLAQMDSILNRTQAANDQYARLLDVNPCHREAWIALERNELEMGPQWQNAFTHFDNAGYDGLAAITRHYFTTWASAPWGDADEYFKVGYGHVTLSPYQQLSADGNLFVARAQRKANDNLLGFAQLNVEQYNRLISTRPTFDAGLVFRTANEMRFTAAGFLENVFENGESMRQDIYRGGGRVQFDWQPARHWEMWAWYRLVDYSDHNQLNNFNIHNAFHLTMPPRQLSLLVDYDFQSFAEPTIRGAEPSLFGTIHPYYAPAGWSKFGPTLEWKHWIGKDIFIEADQCWYLVQYGGRWDSHGNFYSQFRILGTWDIRNWLSASAETSLERSDVYDNLNVMAFLTVRFP